MPEPLLVFTALDDSTTTRTKNPEGEEGQEERDTGVEREKEKEAQVVRTQPIVLPPIIVSRSRSQASTRRVTPTTTTTIPTSSAVGCSTTPACVERRLSNGDLYIGPFSGNVPHGSGKYLWADGCMYEGEWKRGKASGRGKFSWPSGATFEGEFKSGRMEGFGTFIGSDGNTYRGSWSADRRHGVGQKFYSNGDYYEGSWKKNLQDGHGRYVWKNGNEYVGDWKNGVMNGRGTLVWANGNKYDGNWENGIPKGNGVFTWPDGSSYVSTWSNSCNTHSNPRQQQALNGTFYPGNNSKELKCYEFDHKLVVPPLMEENCLVVAAKKRPSVDAERGSVNERAFPRICIWESDGEAGDITCDIVDNVEASMIYRDSAGLDRDGFWQFKRNPCCFSGGEVKKPGQTISKGHKNYDLMLNLQLGIR